METFMFEKWLIAVKSGDPAKFEALLADDFVMTSIRSGKTYDKTKVFEWCSDNTNDVIECLLEDDNVFLIQGRDTNSDGETYAYMEFYEHDGQHVKSGKVVVAKAE